MSGVLIVLIVFSFVAWIVKMGIDNDREKRMLHRADNSITTSELKQMIQSAVEDSHQEMKERLDKLERRLGPANERPQLADRTSDQPDQISGEHGGL